jgi:hypothetical protein
VKTIKEEPNNFFRRITSQWKKNAVEVETNVAPIKVEPAKFLEIKGNVVEKLEFLMKQMDEIDWTQVVRQ